MAKYAELPEAVQRIIDKSAATQAVAHGVTVEEARELLAARVTKPFKHPVKHGTGH